MESGEGASVRRLEGNPETSRNTATCSVDISLSCNKKTGVCLSHLKLEFWSQMFVNGVPQQMFMNGVCVIPRCKDQLGLQKPRYLPQQCLKPRLQMVQKHRYDCPYGCKIIARVIVKQ